MYVKGFFIKTPFLARCRRTWVARWGRICSRRRVPPRAGWPSWRRCRSGDRRSPSSLSRSSSGLWNGSRSGSCCPSWWRRPQNLERNLTLIFWRMLFVLLLRTVVQIEEETAHVLVVNFSASVGFVLGDDFAAILRYKLVLLRAVFQEDAPARYVARRHQQMLVCNRFYY